MGAGWRAGSLSTWVLAVLQAAWARGRGQRACRQPGGQRALAALLRGNGELGIFLGAGVSRSVCCQLSGCCQFSGRPGSAPSNPVTLWPVAKLGDTRPLALCRAPPGCVASTTLLLDIRDSTWEMLPVARAGRFQVCLQQVLVGGCAGGQAMPQLGLTWGLVPTASLPMRRPCRCPTCCPPSCWTSHRAGRRGGAPSPPPSTSSSAST